MTDAKTPSAQRIALASVLAAGLLVAIKLAVGLLSNSLGVLAEAIHSATDLAAAVLTLFAVRVAVRPPDRDHPYGHGKAEHLSALGESVILIAASIGIVTESVIRLSGHGGKVDLHWYTFAVLVLVIAIDSARSIASHRGAHFHDSAALGANALHFTLDLIGSIAVLIGLVLVKAGYPDADSIAALLVAGLALFSAGRLMRRSVHALMDRIPPEDQSSASAQLVLRLAPDSTQVEAEELARHLRAEHPEVADITVWAPKKLFDQ
ncbi:MAG: cation diffusion facilitator family transporter [Solirubrobacteraceae bacterium]